MEETGELIALFKVWLKVLISLCYAYFFVSKLPKGKIRLFSLLPIFSLFTFLPLSLSTPTPAGLTGFFFTWNANFKLLQLAFNFGPLCDDLPRKSLFTFILLAAFPIKIKQNQNSPSGNTPKIDQKLPLNLWVKSLIYCLLVIAAILSDYNKNVHANVLWGIYCCFVYVNLEVILGINEKLVGSILGVELCPPFDEPYLSTSLQDFWGRRWNLMVSDLLRYTIYLPMRAFWEIRLGKRWAPLPAVMASFLVSGLMHELLFYHITRASPTWEVTCFFLLHGVFVAAEIGLKRALGLGREWAVHWALAGPLTVGFVMGTGFWLFLPQLVRNKVDERALEEVKAVGRFVKALFGWHI
uniref:Long-chain-alcohol O-fatty-acyltransferase n=2 Tax=Opuntia streptacantha TaxID=393608 RepID=A0A7C9CES4_OPUST